MWKPIEKENCYTKNDVKYMAYPDKNIPDYFPLIGKIVLKK